MDEQECNVLQPVSRRSHIKIDNNRHKKRYIRLNKEQLGLQAATDEAPWHRPTGAMICSVHSEFNHHPLY